MTELSPMMKRLVQEAHEEAIEKKGARTWGWPGRKQSMILDGSSKTLGRLRRERGRTLGFLPADAVVNAGIAGWAGAGLGMNQAEIANAAGVGAGISAMRSLFQTNRLNRAIRNVKNRKQGAPGPRGIPRKGVYKYLIK